MSYRVYGVEALIEESSVVIYGDFRESEPDALKVLKVLAGTLKEPNALAIRIYVPEGEYFDGRVGLGLYFVKQCGVISSITGDGQGAKQDLDGKFMIQFKASEVARFVEQSEVTEYIMQSGRLGASVRCPSQQRSN